MNVLILSCNTGSGANAAGHALYEEFHSRNIPCTYLDILSFVPEKKKKRMVKAATHYYFQLITRHDATGAPLRSAADRLLHPVAGSKLLAFGKRLTGHLADYIAARDFTLVISTHLFSAAALTYLKLNHCLPAHFYAIAPECSVSSAWKDLKPDALFTSHKDLTRTFMKYGFPHETIFPFGIPLPRSYNNHIPSQEARETLGLPVDGKMVLIVDGSLTTSEFKKTVAALRQNYGPRLLITVLQDQRSLTRHPERFTAKDEHIYYRSNLDQLYLYLDASDLLITKPIGLFPAFACAKQTPLMLTHPYPGLSTRTAQFYDRLGTARLIRSGSTVVSSAEELIENKESRRSMSEAQEAFLRPGIPADICSFILEIDL